MTALGINRELKNDADAKFSAAALTATDNSEGINLQGMDALGLFLDIGTVTGTSPTLDVKVQISFDGGTTWLDTFPEDVNSETQAILAQITASTETSKWWVIPTPAEEDPDDNEVVQGRFVFTVGGTSPSFTITRAQVVTKAFR